MQRFLASLLMMTLYLASNNSSAQQFESFRQIGEASGIAAGTVTSISLNTNGSGAGSQISFFNAAGLSTVYDLDLTPSPVIRDNMLVYMPSVAFGRTEESMNLDDVSFYTATLIDPLNPQITTPAHWFRLTFYDGIWSGAFRIADRIYAIDRSQRDNIVEVRTTPSQNRILQPERQVKVTAIIDEGFVFADAPGDSTGMDSLGHIYALESMHIMEGVMNDSLGISLSVDQLVYQRSSELVSTAQWLQSNAISFGIEDNYASFIFSGDDSIAPVTTSDYAVLNVLDFQHLTTAHRFGELLGIAEESGTLQSNQSPLNFAHWSETQKSDLIAKLPSSPLIQTISSDAPEIEITDTVEIINLIPQEILDSESVESETFDIDESDTGDQLTIGNGLLQSDEQDTNITPQADDTAGGGGKLSPALLLTILLIGFLSRRRENQVSLKI